MQTDVWGVPYKIATEKIHPPALHSTLRTGEGGMTRDWRESAEVLLESLLPSEQQQLNETRVQERIRQQMAVVLLQRLVCTRLQELREQTEEAFIPISTDLGPISRQ